MVAVLADIQGVVRGEHDVVGIVKLARLAALRPPRLQQLALAIEHLDAMVAGIGDPKMVAGVEDDFLRADELTRLGTVTAPTEQETAVGCEFLDAVVLAVFGNVQVALRVLGRAGHEAELARLLALLAAQRAEQLALGRVDQHLEVVRVGDHEIAVAIEAQSGRLAVGVVGRGPGAEEAPSVLKTWMRAVLLTM